MFFAESGRVRTGEWKRYYDTAGAYPCLKISLWDTSGIKKQVPVPEKAHFGHELFKKGEVVPEKACFGHKV
jgi:hypothetical protein